MCSIASPRSWTSSSRERSRDPAAHNPCSVAGNRAPQRPRPSPRRLLGVSRDAGSAIGTTTALVRATDVAVVSLAPHVPLILESLSFTREAFRNYGGYPSEDFRRERLAEVNAAMDAIRQIRDQERKRDE